MTCSIPRFQRETAGKHRSASVSTTHPHTGKHREGAFAHHRALTGWPRLGSMERGPGGGSGFRPGRRREIAPMGRDHR